MILLKSSGGAAEACAKLHLICRQNIQNEFGNRRLNVTDQKSLRIALYESALRIAVLGPEYDFAPAHVSFACAAVRILHGRGFDFAALSGRLNARLGNRVYHPQVDVMLHAETSAAELRRIWQWSTLQLVRRLAVTFIYAAPSQLSAAEQGRPPPFSGRAHRALGASASPHNCKARSTPAHSARQSRAAARQSHPAPHPSRCAQRPRALAPRFNGPLATPALRFSGKRILSGA